MSKIAEKYAELPRPVRKPLWRLWHNLITSFDKQATTVFMNYGYASENGEFSNLELKPENEAPYPCPLPTSSIFLPSKLNRKENIHRKAPKFLHKSFYRFAGVEGSERFDAFDKNKIDYRSYTLHK